MVNVNEDDRAEAEREIRDLLEVAGYDYGDLFDEVSSLGLTVGLRFEGLTIEVEVTRGWTVLAKARMSHYSQPSVDRAARQVRAQLQVDGETPGDQWGQHGRPAG